MTGTAFQVQGTNVLYLLRNVDPAEAEHKGCPGATHVIRGRYNETIGSLRPVTGREVKVPGWGQHRRGVLSWFTPWGAPDTGEPIKGWVG